jgi:hypothetical protein
VKAPKSLETLVISQLIDAYGSFDPKADSHAQDRVAPPANLLVQLWTSVVDRQGEILAQLALRPATRAELLSSMDGLVLGAPAWLNAHLREEETMTIDLFLFGMAQTMGKQRQEIERVVAEQIREPKALDEILKGSSLPENPEEVERKALMTELADAITAHSEVLIGIAAEIDALTRGP